MSLSTVSEAKDQFVKFVVSGEYNVIALLGLTTQIKSEADELGRNRILVDLRHVKGDILNVERLLAGSEVARVFGSDYRICVVAPAELINNVAKTAANIRGGKMNVVSSEDEAVRWLLLKDDD